MKSYKNYISLGYNCFVAMDLTKLGLRSYTYPFDWMLSDIEGVVKAIENHFDGLLNIDNMVQNKEHPHQYYDSLYKLWYYHDFNGEDSLEKQLPKVIQKYERRIERFYNAIKEPTLFVRYIDDTKKDGDGKISEIAFLEKNNDRFLQIIEEYNSENDIIYIGPQNVASEKIDIWASDKEDTKDDLKEPLYSNSKLCKMLTEVEYPNRENNLSKTKSVYEAWEMRNQLLMEELYGQKGK